MLIMMSKSNLLLTITVWKTCFPPRLCAFARYEASAYPVSPDDSFQATLVV